MKIKKSELRRLIENYLFEEEKKGLQNSQAYTGGKGMKGEHLRTKDVKFSWGTYKGKHANERYVILQGEKDLGDYQKNGDPFTYKELPNGKHKVVSGPAKFDSSIGKTVTIKKKGSGKSGGKGGKGGKSVNDADSTIEDLLQFSNLAKIKTLINRRNRLVENFQSIPSTSKFEKDGDMVSIKKHIESRIGNRPGVVPSMFSKSLEKDASDGKDFKEYFPVSTMQYKLEQPFKTIDMLGDFDVNVSVNGGGNTGQSEAIRLAISRALCKFDVENRTSLKSEGLLRRDSRVVERKKPGQKKARKKFQWVKR